MRERTILRSSGIRIRWNQGAHGQHRYDRLRWSIHVHALRLLQVDPQQPVLGLEPLVLLMRVLNRTLQLQHLLLVHGHLFLKPASKNEVSNTTTHTVPARYLPEHVSLLALAAVSC